MKYEPLVSIVTSSFGHAAFLPEYFDSILAQTHGRIELTFVDDGSPDQTWEIASGYELALKQKLERVNLIRQANQGPFRTLDQAIAQATGELLCILESDDYFLPDKVRRAVDFLRDNPDIGLVHTGAHWLRDGRLEHDYWQRGRQIPTGQVYRQLLHGNFILTCSMTCRTHLLRQFVSFERYQSRGYLMGDYPMFLDLARHVNFGYIPEATVVYRLLPESASHSRDLARSRRFTRSLYRVRLDYAREDLESETRFTDADLVFYHLLSYSVVTEGFFRDAFSYQLQLLRGAGWRWILVGQSLRSMVRVFLILLRRIPEAIFRRGKP